MSRQQNLIAPGGGVSARAGDPRRQFILRRQRLVYLRKDGVTKQTAPAIEALYTDALRELDTILARRPLLFGDRPCEADFGLFGPASGTSSAIRRPAP